MNEDKYTQEDIPKIIAKLKIDEKDEKLHSYVDNVIEYIVIGIWDNQMSDLGRYL